MGEGLKEAIDHHKRLASEMTKYQDAAERIGGKCQLQGYSWVLYLKGLRDSPAARPAMVCNKDYSVPGRWHGGAAACHIEEEKMYCDSDAPLAIKPSALSMEYEDDPGQFQTDHLRTVRKTVREIATPIVIEGLEKEIPSLKSDLTAQKKEEFFPFRIPPEWFEKGHKCGVALHEHLEEDDWEYHLHTECLLPSDPKTAAAYIRNFPPLTKKIQQALDQRADHVFRKLSVEENGED